MRKKKFSGVFLSVFWTLEIIAIKLEFSLRKLFFGQMEMKWIDWTFRVAVHDTIYWINSCKCFKDEKLQLKSLSAIKIFETFFCRLNLSQKISKSSRWWFTSSKKCRNAIIHAYLSTIFDRFLSSFVLLSLSRIPCKLTQQMKFLMFSYVASTTRPSAEFHFVLMRS